MYKVTYQGVFNNIVHYINIKASSKQEAEDIFNRRYNYDNVVKFVVKKVEKL